VGLRTVGVAASLLKRLPIRFNYDDNYYNSAPTGDSRTGLYGHREKILDHPGITLKLDTPFNREMDVAMITFLHRANRRLFEFGQAVLVSHRHV